MVVASILSISSCCLIVFIVLCCVDCCCCIGWCPLICCWSRVSLLVVWRLLLWNRMLVSELSPPDEVDRLFLPCLPGICGLCRTGETCRHGPNCCWCCWHRVSSVAADYCSLLCSTVAVVSAAVETADVCRSAAE